MKNLLKNNQLVLILATQIFIGIYIGLNIGNEMENYLVFLSNIAIRYLLIFLSLYIDYIVYVNLSQAPIIMRYKSKEKHYKKIICTEILFKLIEFILISIIVMILNINMAIKYINIFLMLIFNFLMISQLFSSIIKLIDSYIKNKILSNIIFLFIFVNIDFILEHFIFFFGTDSQISLGEIFILPAIIDNYILLAIFLILIWIFLSNIFIANLTRKDYLLNQNENFK